MWLLVGMFLYSTFKNCIFLYCVFIGYFVKWEMKVLQSVALALDDLVSITDITVCQCVVTTSHCCVYRNCAQWWHECQLLETTCHYLLPISPSPSCHFLSLLPLLFPAAEAVTHKYI